MVTFENFDFSGWRVWLISRHSDSSSSTNWYLNLYKLYIFWKFSQFTIKIVWLSYQYVVCGKSFVTSVADWRVIFEVFPLKILKFSFKYYKVHIIRKVILIPLIWYAIYAMLYDRKKSFVRKERKFFLI